VPCTLVRPAAHHNFQINVNRRRPLPKLGWIGLSFACRRALAREPGDCMRYHYLIFAAALVAGPVAADIAMPAGRHQGAPGGSNHPHARPPGSASGEHDGPFHHRHGDAVDAGADSATPGSHRPPGAELWRKLHERNPNLPDLKERLAKWHASREERQREHRRSLFSRWGARAHQPSSVAELRLHAQREARLTRLEEVAGTERSGEERQRLLDKLDKLREREKERHERAMQRLALATPGASAAPSAAAPSAAPATSGGPQ
jgi:hypothetical protein